MARHADFEINYIRWALTLAIFAGFSLGAHVISIIAFGFPLGRGFYGYIQTHGHIQLVGWAGLFILGVSLHFIPRLAGVPIAPANRMRIALNTTVSGLIIRFFTHSMLAYIPDSPLFTPVSFLAALSGVLVWFGCATYVVTIIHTMQKIPSLEKRPALKAVKPFFMMMMTGWLIYPAINMVLLFSMAGSGAASVHQGWNESAVQIFTNLVLLPVAFAFSVRLFPLFLRLPVIDWSVIGIAVTFLIAVLLQVIPTLPPAMALESQMPLKIAGTGMALKCIVILFFIGKLDLLTRRRAPWTTHRTVQPVADLKPTRPGLPDYGEFGPFEKLIYSAYIWLIFGALMEGAIGLSILFAIDLPISSDAVRHAYLLGFITQLILGMAPRMLPGFLGKRKVAKPALVRITFWLANIAVVSRVLPLVIPVDWLGTLPGALIVAQSALGFSGLFGIVTIVLLAVNLRATEKLN